MNNYNGMITMYEGTSNRTRQHEYAPGYSAASHEYKDYQNRSRSPRDHSPRRKSNRSLSPLINQRVYDGFVCDDKNSYSSFPQDNYNKNSSRDSERDDRSYRDTNKDHRSDERRYGRDRRRSRSRDRSRSSRDGRERRDTSRERRNSDEDRYSDRSGRKQQDREYGYRSSDVYKYDSNPSSTVIVQNLGLEATEQKIEDHLRLSGVVANHVAIIRDRNNGKSKGYGFVEFNDVDTAEKWLNLTKRRIIIDGRPVQLDFSKSKKSELSSSPSVIPDWNCFQCNAVNFGSRKRHEKQVTCFRCGVVQNDENSQYSKQQTKERSSSDILNLEPCNVLMIRGMAFSTTEDEIRYAITKLTTRAVYDVRLIKDKVTNMSRGFAFVELGNVEDASELLEKIEHSDFPFEIDNRRISAGYARHGFAAPPSSKKGRSSLVSNKTAAENAVAQASAAQATAEYSQSMADLYMSTGAVKQSYNTTGQQTGQAPQPVSSYVYDPTSGYYYDSSTGLYYDANTGYYYNGTTGQFLYWNGSKYQVVNSDGTISADATNTNVTAQPEQKNESSEKEKVNISGQKPKNARKIAKDMERWAKKMNTATEAKKTAVKQAQDELRALEQKEEELRKQIVQEKAVTSILGQVAANKDGIRSLFVPDDEDEVSVLQLGSSLSSNSSTKLGSNVIAATDLPEDDDDDFVDETKFVDQVKMACLLCKRQFPSKEVLTKHLQISQLHQQNLEKYQSSRKT
ncbi:RNA-binding protein 5-like isoform X2 [Hydractinia symbiolongicarpus]|uniref:RNA-binding protein 5-like isoform X2 n=1 Tax=Hydractinia symbiolongicarpus TaxID=13093 RepID=UPI00254AC921|nr:RNA-binding protein 5-like isoform X2 [Hydractinia symbiolongicarpus]